MTKRSKVLTLLMRVRKLKRFLKEGEYASALPIVMDLAENLPDSPDLQSVLALCLDQTGNPDEALDVLQAAMEKFPGEHSLALQFTSVLFHLKRDDEAEVALRKALAVIPPEDRINRSNAMVMIGMLLNRRGEKEEARREWEKALTENPENGEAERLLEWDGVEEVEEDEELQREVDRLSKLVEKEKFAEAESLGRSLTARYPDEPEFPVLRSVALWRMQKERKAAKVLRQAIQRFPDDWFIRNLLGNVLHDSSELNDAVEAYRDALKCSDIPTSSEAEVRCSLADALWGMSSRDEALEQWKNVLELDPGNKEAKKALEECVNEYGEPKAPHPTFDDLYHFMNIHTDRYFRLVGREEFDTIDEAKRVLGFIQESWNIHITPHSRELDDMSAKRKSALFRKVTLNFAPLIAGGGPTLKGDPEGSRRKSR